jgi:branched-chain amino acid transport system substrate-binding protein
VDAINCVEQAQEFGLAGRRTRPAAMIGLIPEIHSLGLPAAQGLVLTESFYWDLNDRTRALNGRLRGKMLCNHVPNSARAQGYGAVFRCLRAVVEIGMARAKAPGLGAMPGMKRLPADDDADGRKLLPTRLFQVEAPDGSRGPRAYFKPVATPPAEQAFRPLAEGNCPLIEAWAPGVRTGCRRPGRRSWACPSRPGRRHRRPKNRRGRRRRRTARRRHRR